MLDDHLIGVYKHEQQIKEQAFVATYKSDSEEVTLTPQDVSFHSIEVPTL